MRLGVPLHHLRAGMPERVVEASRYNRKLGIYRRQKLRRTGSQAAVMADFEQVGVRVLLNQQLLNAVMRVTDQQCRGLAVLSDAARVTRRLLHGRGAPSQAADSARESSTPPKLNSSPAWWADEDDAELCWQSSPPRRSRGISDSTPYQSWLGRKLAMMLRIPPMWSECGWEMATASRRRIPRDQR